MTTAPNLTQAMRQAQRVLATRHNAKRAPAVAWAGLGEPPEAFAARCAAIKGRILAPVPYAYPVPAGVEAVEFPPKLFELLHPQRPSRYRAASGGRGSAKSHSFATAVVLRAFTERIRILCGREIQRSLRESVHQLLGAKIDRLGLTRYFDVNDRAITCSIAGSEIIFAGLSTNVQQLKSLEDVGLAYFEEAESISARSFEIMIPTIRAPASEFLLAWNPDEPEAPVERFRGSARADVKHVHVTFRDNPWFPKELEAERAYLQSVDDDAYRHIWEGECRLNSQAQILRGKYVVEEFEPSLLMNGPYFGLDFGFSQDPTAAVAAWIFGRELYISHEIWQIGCDIDRLPTLLDELPGATRHVMRADDARPETISYLQRHGYPRVIAVEKGKGSVEDGIAHLRSYERIVIHPRCTHTLEEARLYSYKVDRLTRDVLPDPVDANNHCIDALRYALQPLMRRRGGYALGVL